MAPFSLSSHQTVGKWIGWGRHPRIWIEQSWRNPRFIYSVLHRENL